MTGRELIIYILQNHLEDEPVFSDKGFLNLLSLSEAAKNFGVGPATIRTWYNLGYLKGVQIGNEVYILPVCCFKGIVERSTK